ncbi:MAG: DUF4003 family protein [Planctomycetes bacterium]|nr:DUF4003 family protein [Planctomycetota bacterium]
MSTRQASADVLDRFLAVANELRNTGGWFEDWSVLRHAALTLPLIDADPAALVRDLRRTIAEFAKRTRWWETAHGSLRQFLAAALVREDESVADFCAELKRVQALFRAAKLPRGGTGEALAFVTLREHAPKRRVSATEVGRMRELFTEIKKDHRWLLDEGEYPTIALLSTTGVAAGEVARRVEEILQRLTASGFRSRGKLLPVSQLLFFAPEPDAAACTRFEALWKEFLARGLRMNSDDYDEVALLAFVPREASKVVRTVLEHRESIDTLRPKPSRNASFSLAASTAFLELVGNDPRLRKLSNTQAALQVRSILVARRAAAVAAAS